MRDAPQGLSGFPPPGTYAGALTGLDHEGYQNKAVGDGATVFPFSDPHHFQAYYQNPKLSAIDDAEYWNRKLVWHVNDAGNGVYIGAFNGTGAVSVPGTQEVVVYREITPDLIVAPVGTQYASTTGVAGYEWMWTSCTNWIPYSTAVGQKLWPLIPLGVSSALAALQLGITPATLAGWGVRQIRSAPTLPPDSSMADEVAAALGWTETIKEGAGNLTPGHLNPSVAGVNSGAGN